MKTSASENLTPSAPSSARRNLFFILSAIAMSAAVGVAACAGGGGATGENENGAGGIGDDREPDGGGGDGGEPDAGGGGGGEGDCPLGPPQDPSTLAECCDEFGGGAHCLPGDQVSADAKKDLAACEDGTSYCAPDKWIEGETELVDCDAGDLGPGVCLSPCIPQVGEAAGFLEQGSCDEGELCAPCDFGGNPTGACDIDLSCKAPDDPGDGGGDGGEDPDGGDGGDDGGDDGTDDGTDDGGEPGGGSCCSDRGTCISPELAGEDADKLQQDTCTGEDELCAPNDLIQGDYQAEACDSTVLFVPVEGACMHDCLANTDLFNEDGCGGGFKCVPCQFPPLFGQETGACDYL